MGSTSPRQSSALTRNWRYVSPSLIRNQLTRELIEQRHLCFVDSQQQAMGARLLSRRIRLQHANVIKLIYYAPQVPLCGCSLVEGAYRTKVYTEYAGESLGQCVRLGGEVGVDGGCLCVGVVQGVSYLMKYYGCFEVEEEMVFWEEVGQGRGNVRVWVNGDRAQLKPKRPCSEDEMLQSLVSLFGFIRANGFCKRLGSDDVSELGRCRGMVQMKGQILSLHGSKQYQQPQGRQQKSYSAVQRKVVVEGPVLVEEGRQGKPSSLPHHVSVQGEKKIQFTKLEKGRAVSFQGSKQELPRKIKQTMVSTQQTLNLLNSNKSVQLSDQHGSHFHLPVRRVHFNYPSVAAATVPWREKPMQSTSTTKFSKVQIKGVISEMITPRSDEREVYRVPVEIVFSEAKEGASAERKEVEFGGYGRDTTFSSNNIRVMQPSDNPKIVINTVNLGEAVSGRDSNGRQPGMSFDHQGGSYAVSKAGTVQSSRGESHTGLVGQVGKPPVLMGESSFTCRQMELKFQGEGRGRKSRRQREGMHPISEAKQSGVSGNGNWSSRKSNSKPNVIANLSRSGKKLQRYTREIKQYQERIRQRLSNSTGSKGSKVIQGGLMGHSQRQGEFKETKSLYNQSEGQEERESGGGVLVGVVEGQQSVQLLGEQNQKALRTQYLRRQQQQRLRQWQNRRQRERQRQKELQIERLRELASAEKIRMQLELQRIGELSHQTKLKVVESSQAQRAFEQIKQKLQLQRDLQSEKRLIREQMQQLLRHNAMRDEYMSIREKVKQKKQTFAQLKAQAAKILEDCLY